MKKGIIVLMTALGLILSACDSKEAVMEAPEQEVLSNGEKDTANDEALTEQLPEHKENDTKTEPETEESASKTVDEMLEAWDATFENIFLEDMVMALNREKILFWAEYNRSGEIILFEESFQFFSDRTLQRLF